MSGPAAQGTRLPARALRAGPCDDCPGGGSSHYSFGAFDCTAFLERLRGGPGNGYYSFVNKPTEHEIAPAPSWFLEGWEAICNPGASSGGGGFLSKEAKSNLFQRSSIDARYDAFKCQEILRDYLQPATNYQDYETWLTGEPDAAAKLIHPAPDGFFTLEPTRIERNAPPPRAKVEKASPQMKLL